MKPIEFTVLADDLSEELRASCKPGLMPMAGVRVSPSNCAMPEEYELYAERLRNFEVYEDDTWVISYPKCGEWVRLPNHKGAFTRLPSTGCSVKVITYCNCRVGDDIFT